MEPKKISFSFSKISKTSKIYEKPKANPEHVQLIDCLEGQSIKVKGIDHSKIIKKLLVIPMTRKVESTKVAEPNLTSVKSDNKVTGDDVPVVQKDEKVCCEIINKVVDKPSLDTLAANEIIASLTKDGPTNAVSNLAVPLLAVKGLTGGERESTLDDYENIPIVDFGMAMLRGMGWKPTVGKVSMPESGPVLRPKGMGLGADRPAPSQKKPQNVHTKSTEAEPELKLMKGAFVKVVMGKNQNTYGQVEGLDDDSGRLIIKMALSGAKVSMNEFMVELVAKAEYEKNSKVLNVAKYEEYKNKEKLRDNGAIDEKQPADVKIKQESSKRSSSPTKTIHEVRSSSEESDYKQRSRKDHKNDERTGGSSFKHYSTDRRTTGDDNDSRSSHRRERRDRPSSRSPNARVQSHKPHRDRKHSPERNSNDRHSKKGYRSDQTPPPKHNKNYPDDKKMSERRRSKSPARKKKHKHRDRSRSRTRN